MAVVRVVPGLLTFIGIIKSTGRVDQLPPPEEAWVVALAELDCEELFPAAS
jgi:hypothetical protein